MHLPEIFGLSTFPVFWPSLYFDGQNKSGIIITVVLNVQFFFAKLTKNVNERPKYTEKCQKCQNVKNIPEFSTFDGICQK